MSSPIEPLPGKTVCGTLTGGYEYARFHPPSEGRSTIVRLASSLVVYPVGIVLLTALYDQPALLAGILVALSVVTILIDRRTGDVIVFAGGAVLGPIAEVFAVRAAAWTYAHPSFLGIPLWLPIAWGLATLLIKRISEGLLEILSSRHG